MSGMGTGIDPKVDYVYSGPHCLDQKMAILSYTPESLPLLSPLGLTAALPPTTLSLPVLARTERG